MNGLALLIGNNRYIDRGLVLHNAVKDSVDLSHKLESLGFHVICKTDCSLEDFDIALDKFEAELKKYEVGVFFYSGHGVQIEGVNYLLATDTKVIDNRELKRSAASLDDVIRKMTKASTRTKIIILDACRDNPMKNKYRDLYQPGLAPIQAPQGTLIAFSTSPGEKAKDGSPGKNSIYASALLKHIEVPGIQVEALFKRVRTTVYEMSAKKQTSWEHTSLIGEFSFNLLGLVHAIELPYEQSVVCDATYVDSGTTASKIVLNMKSRDWETQKHALWSLESADVSNWSRSELFLIGRNVVQVAEGGEYTTRRRFDNLGGWLEQFGSPVGNDVLRGMLFEVYFNSKGHLRERSFKANFCDQIMSLVEDEVYKDDFSFISRQLKPFSNRLVLKDHCSKIGLALEIKFDKISRGDPSDDKFAYQLMSISHNGKEYYNSQRSQNTFEISEPFSAFEKALSLAIGAPKSKLILSYSHSVKDNNLIYRHSQFELVL